MIKVSIILLAGLAAAAVLRRRSAALRHLVLAAALVGAAAMPVLELIVPAWRLPASLLPAGDPSGPLTLLIPVSLAPVDGGEAPRRDGGAAGPARRGTWMRRTWVAGIAVHVAILIAGFARLSRLASRSRPADARRWTGLAGELAKTYRLRRPVRLLQSDHPALLVTWGVRRPRVILPRDADRWTEDRARIVLGHELAHVARGDWAVHLLAELVRAVYWFNPLAWIARRRLRLESEHACDDAVLSLGIGGPEYAAHLVELARAFRERTLRGVPAPAMARPSSLERRVRAMLNSRLDRTPIGRLGVATVLLALSVVTVPIAGLALSAQNTAAAFSGSLMDAVGRVMPGVTLVLSHVPSEARFEAQSDSAGRFAFAGLPAGEYQLGVRRPGFATSQGRLVLTAGQALDRNVALQIGRIEETITVVTSPGESAPGSARRRVAGVRRTPNDADDACSQSVVGGCIKQPTKNLRRQAPVSTEPAGRRARGDGGPHRGRRVHQGSARRRAGRAGLRQRRGRRRAGMAVHGHAAGRHPGRNAHPGDGELRSPQLGGWTASATGGVQSAAMSATPRMHVTGARVYYGWAVLLVAAGAMVGTLPGRTQGLGLITEPLLADLQIDRVTYATLNFWATLVGAAGAIGIGRLIDRFGSRAILTVLALALGAVVCVMSRSTTIAALAAGLLLTRALGQSALSVVSLAMVGQWFVRRIDAAMAVFSIVMSIGFMIAFPLVGASVQVLGWRATWFGIGAAIAVLLAPSAWLVVRRSPEAAGLLPDGETATTGPAARAPAPDDLGGYVWTAALRTPAFWMFAVGAALYGLVASGIGLFNESILAERGLGPDVYYQSLVVTAMTALAGNFAGGWLATRMPLPRLLAISLGILTAGLAVLPHVVTALHVAVWAAAMGLGGGFVMVLFFAVWPRVFGRRHLGQIQGIAQAVTVLASALGPLLLAWCVDWTGSYAAMFRILAAVMASVATGALLISLPDLPEQALGVPPVDSETCA